MSVRLQCKEKACQRHMTRPDIAGHFNCLTGGVLTVLPPVEKNCISIALPEVLLNVHHFFKRTTLDRQCRPTVSACVSPAKFCQHWHLKLFR